MEYRRLGSSGLNVSALSFGSWVTFGKQVDIDKAAAEMKVALDSGVNFFDNAEAYEAGKSEIVMGKAIKKLGLTRKDYVISTKIFWGGSGPNDTGLSRKHIVEGTRAALERMDLGLDHYVNNRDMDPVAWVKNHTGGRGVDGVVVAASVKALDQEDLMTIGAQIILGNAYHLYLCCTATNCHITTSVMVLLK